MKQLLLKGWGLPTKCIREIQDNVWLIETDRDSFALKRSLLKEKNLDFICRAEDVLTANGFHHFALPQNTIDGKSFLRFGNQCFTLHQWIHGEKCDFERLPHLQAAATTLADFHLRSREPKLQHMEISRCNVFIRCEQMTKHIEDIYRFYRNTAEQNTLFSRTYRSFFPDMIHRAEQARKELLYSAYPRLAAEAAAVGSFIHYDVAARNFIIREGQAHLIDFDYCCCDTPLTDLMRLFKRSFKHGKKEEGIIDSILTGYSVYRPLTAEEGRVLCALLRFPQKFWRVSRRCICEAQTEEEVSVKKLEQAFEESLREDYRLLILKEKLEEYY